MKKQEFLKAISEKLEKSSSFLAMVEKYNLNKDFNTDYYYKPYKLSIGFLSKDKKVDHSLLGIEINNNVITIKRRGFVLDRFKLIGIGEAVDRIVFQCTELIPTIKKIASDWQ